jgi:hypothetical protein
MGQWGHGRPGGNPAWTGQPSAGLHHKEHGLLGRSCSSVVRGDAAGSSAFAARAIARGAGVRRQQRERKQVQNAASASGKPYCTRCPSSLLSFCCGDPSRSSATPPAQGDRSADTGCSGNRRTLTRRRTPGLGGHRSFSTCTGRDLPMPASPLSNTTCPRPSLDLCPTLSSSPSCSPTYQRGRPVPRPLPGSCGPYSHAAPDEPDGLRQAFQHRRA